MPEPSVCELPAKTGTRAGLAARGTPAGYGRHLRIGEPPCAECRQAENRRTRRRYAANPAPKLTQGRAWRHANTDRMRELNRRWYTENLRRKTETVRRWRQANIERVRDYERQYRARKASALVVPFTPEQLEQRLSMFGFRCYLRIHCDGAPGDTVDHVIPLFAGGPHCLSNLRPACSSCNPAKGTQRLTDLS